MRITIKNHLKFVKFGTILQFLLSFIILFNIFSVPINIESSAFSLPKTESENKLTSAEGMATIEVSSGRLLYSKDENKRLPMASTTKILTAIVAIESGKDLDEKHIIPSEAVGIEGSSIYLRKGEHLSLRELLYGLMLRSGNDSAVAIAVIVSGSVENFAKLMNEYCDKLNLSNTHIVTVNGLHDDDHYTTAFELAKITAYAFKNKTFAEIVSTKSKVIDNELGKKDKNRYLKNKNKLLSNLKGGDGVKTGYTTKAGKCFVGSATRNGMQIVCVVLNCANMFDDCTKLIEKAFQEYKLVKLLNKGELFKIDNEIENAKGSSVFLEKDIIFPLSVKELNTVKGKAVLDNKKLSSSIEKQIVGSIEIEIENNLIFSEKLYTIFIEEKATFEDKFKKIIQEF